MRIDHVIYATRDLDRATARLEAELGLPAVGGGRHEGLGTHNRIMPLGEAYLEVLAVCDADEAASSALGRALTARIEEVSEGLMGWVLRVDELQPVASRLDTKVLSITRQGVSGQLTGVLESLREPYLPFFVARGASDPLPGHRDDRDCDIDWIEVTGDVARLDWWLDGAALPVRISDGAPGLGAIGICGQVLA